MDKRLRYVTTRNIFVVDIAIVFTNKWIRTTSKFKYNCSIEKCEWMSRVSTFYVYCVRVVSRAYSKV